jgi:hypothetical protein
VRLVSTLAERDECAARAVAGRSDAHVLDNLALGLRIWRRQFGGWVEARSVETCALVSHVMDDRRIPASPPRRSFRSR